MNQQQWIKEKNYFGLGCLVSTTFLLISFFSPIIYSDNELHTETFIFESADIEEGESSSVTVHFSNTLKVFYIHQYEKRYLNWTLFSQLHSDDSLLVSFRDEDIYQIGYQYIELIDKSKADKHKIESRKPMRYMSIAGLILCLIPYSFQKQPSFRFLGRAYILKANLIWLGVVFIVLLVVRLFVYTLNPLL